MNRKEYIEKADTHLQDTNTYQQITIDPTTQIENKIRRTLKKLANEGQGSQEERKRMNPTDSTIAKFYGLHVQLLTASYKRLGPDGQRQGYWGCLSGIKLNQVELNTQSRRYTCMVMRALPYTFSWIDNPWITKLTEVDILQQAATCGRGFLSKGFG